MKIAVASLFLFVSASPHHDPNTKHCLNGADGMFMSNATHDYRFIKLIISDN